MPGKGSMVLIGAVVLGAAGACSPRPEFAARPNPMARPAHCELQEVGPFYVPGSRRPDQARIRAMGFDAARYLKAVPGRGSGGRTAGWEGLGLRWNDPACKSR